MEKMRVAEKVATDALGAKARGALKWSLLTEVIARIISPVTQLILARLLAPEAFGILATVVMVTSFAEMLADAGFQKYLVQKEFRDKRDLDEHANVAFWSSMAIALILFASIVFFRDPLANVVGNQGLGLPLAVTAISAPLAVAASTQLALFRRAFRFKQILPIRVGSAFIMLITTVPLALVGWNYWALIAGTLASVIVNAIALMIVSPWKPKFFYSFSLLRRMFSFSAWSLLEALSIWMTSWAGTFIVGSLLSPHELGLYKQPMTIVTAMFAIVTSATTPVLFSALSRLQFEQHEFQRFFLKFQFSVALAVLPLGIGAYVFRDFLTGIFFGPQWNDAALMFGAWSLSTAFMIIFAHYCSEIYRSLGKPRISLLSQMVYMMVMIPALYFAALDGFLTLVVVNATVRCVSIIINQILTKSVAGIGFICVLKNLYPALIASATMAAIAFGWVHFFGTGTSWSLLGIVSCILVYVAACFLFRKSRLVLLGLAKMVRGAAPGVSRNRTRH